MGIQRSSSFVYGHKSWRSSSSFAHFCEFLLNRVSAIFIKIYFVLQVICWSYEDCLKTKTLLNVKRRIRTVPYFLPKKPSWILDPLPCLTLLELSNLHQVKIWSRVFLSFILTSKLFPFWYNQTPKFYWFTLSFYIIELCFVPQSCHYFIFPESSWGLLSLCSWCLHSFCWFYCHFSCCWKQTVGYMQVGQVSSLF